MSIQNAYETSTWIGSWKSEITKYNRYTHLFAYHDSIALFAANLNSRFAPKNFWYLDKEIGEILSPFLSLLVPLEKWEFSFSDRLLLDCYFLFRERRFSRSRLIEIDRSIDRKEPSSIDRGERGPRVTSDAQREADEKHEKQLVRRPKRN